MKRKVLASLLVVAVVVGLVGAATWAYFSDTGKSEANTFTAGTLNLQLFGNPDWHDNVSATWQSPSNWAPGESVEATLYMRNAGSIGVTHIGVKVDNLGGTGLADAVLLSKFVYTEYWDYANTTPGTTLNEYDLTGWVISLIDANTDGKGTLSEFITWCAEPHSLKFFEGPWESGEPYLHPGEAKPQHLILGFTFDADAENEYQGKTATFDLSVLAAQSYAQWPPVWWTTPSHGY